MQRKNIHVVGVSGMEGAAIGRFLTKWGLRRMVFHAACDRKDFSQEIEKSHRGLSTLNTKELATSLLRAPQTFYFGKEYLHTIEEADHVFVPQSWFLTNLYPKNKKLLSLQNRISFSTITELYFRLSETRLLGVTGSNGKSTTTQMCINILSQGPDNVWSGGNDRGLGHEALLHLEDMKPKEWLVLEVSNRQLKYDLGCSPHIGVVTNISHNHVEEHGSFEALQRAKGSLLKYQRGDDWAVLNADDPGSQDLIQQVPGKLCLFSLSSGAAFNQMKLWNEAQAKANLQNGMLCVSFQNREHHICSESELRLRGRHNVANALAAAACGVLAGIDDLKIGMALRSFQGLPGRLEHIRTLRGVRYYDDYVATTPESVMADFDTLKGDIFWILGGSEKQLEYSKLVPFVAKRVRWFCFLTSPFSKIFRKLLQDYGVAKDRFIEFDHLKDALLHAAQHVPPGNHVVLAPLAAYQAYFGPRMKGYLDFKKFVHELGEQ